MTEDSLLFKKAKEEKCEVISQTNAIKRRAWGALAFFYITFKIKVEKCKKHFVCTTYSRRTLSQFVQAVFAAYHLIYLHQGM